MAAATVKAAGGVPSKRMATDEIEAPPFAQLARKSLKRSLDMFVGNYGLKPADNLEATSAKIQCKVADEYAGLHNELGNTSRAGGSLLALKDSGAGERTQMVSLSQKEAMQMKVSDSFLTRLVDDVTSNRHAGGSNGTPNALRVDSRGIVQSTASEGTGSNALLHLTIRKACDVPKPVWHPPWKLYRVISGHQGWVQCLAVDKSNEWFASGGNDRLIKIWDLATGTLKLSLTGHINTVRDLAISNRHPYLFSCGEDNRVKCWDLEQNKVVRDYHGHLSGVYCLAVHPSLDILASGGRDAVVRLWDMRTKAAIHVLSGHQGTITSLQSQSVEPQLISGSQDRMVRLWDIAAGKCITTLTNHKKSIRALAFHPQDYSFCSAAADNIKVWVCPEGRFDRNISGHNAIVNCCAVKHEGDSSVLVAGTNNGQLNFWDWKSGYKFDTIQSKVQPGSLESENGVFACVFDKSETRLITGECDKTIKMWKEDENATPETHPISWKPPRDIRRY